jgi:hypothetical protein
MTMAVFALLFPRSLLGVGTRHHFAKDRTHPWIKRGSENKCDDVVLFLLLMYRSTLFLPLFTHIEVLIVWVQAPTLYPLFTNDFEWKYISEGTNKAIPARKQILP